LNSILIFILLIVTPLLFFTDMTRNPYYIQIVTLNICILLFWAYRFYLALKQKIFVFHKTPLDIPLLVFIGVIFLSITACFVFPHPQFGKNGLFHPLLPQLFYSIYSEAGKNVAFVIINWILAFWMFVTFMEDNKKIDYILSLCFITTTLASIYGIMQYFGMEIFWPKVLNPYGGRCVSTFGNPNFLSAFLIVIIPFLLYKLILAKNVVIRIFYFIINSIVFWALVCSLTRSSWLGLAAGLIVFVTGLYYFFPKVMKTQLPTLLALGITFGIILSLLPQSSVSGYHPRVTERLTEIQHAVKNVYPPLHQRVLIWSCAWDMIKERPVIGKGWGVFELFYPFYQSKYLLQIPEWRQLRTHANNAHNEILEVLSQTGIIGLGVFIWIWILFFAFSYKTLRSYALEPGESKQNTGVLQQRTSDGLLVLAAVSSSVCMLADNLLNVSLHFVVPVLVFWMAVAIVIVKGTNRENIDSNTVVTLDLNKHNFRPWLYAGIILTLYMVTVNFRFFIGETYYFKGFKLVRRGELKTAQVMLENARKWHRFEVNNTYELGNTYARNRELDKALWAYDEALKSNLGYDEIYFNLATVESMLNKHEEAYINYKRATSINPLSLDAFLSLGNYYLRKLDTEPSAVESATRVFKHIISVDPQNKESYNNLGYMYLRKKDRENAAECFARAVQIDPGFELARRNLLSIGGSYANNLPPANSSAIDDDTVFANLDNLIRSNKWSLAETEALRLVKINPTNLKSRLYLGNIFYQLKKYGVAAQEYNYILKLSPSNAAAHANLGLTYIELRNYRNAKTELETALSITPGNKTIQNALNQLKALGY